jgi:hypothetical protein
MLGQGPHCRLERRGDVEDPTTIALNLTFFGTVGVAFVMFFGLFIVFVLTLVLAGLGRLVGVAVMALAGFLGRSPSESGTKPAKAPRPAKKEPQLSAEWAAAVARADLRAMARAESHSRAEDKAEDRPQDKPQVRERKAG